MLKKQFYEIKHANKLLIFLLFLHKKNYIFGRKIIIFFRKIVKMVWQEI